MRNADAANSKLVVEPVTDTAVDNGLSYFFEVPFDKGKADLDPKTTQGLNDFMDRSARAGQVQGIKILSFSDLAPTTSLQHDFLNRQKHLADVRNATLKKFLASQFPLANIESYNASANPSALEEMVKASDANVRKTLEDAGMIVGNEQNVCVPKIVSKSLIVSIMKKSQE